MSPPKHIQDYSKPQANDSSAIDTTLQVSSFVLQVLQDGAQFSPVPFLQDAAGVALTILNAVQVRFCVEVTSTC